MDNNTNTEKCMFCSRPIGVNDWNVGYGYTPDEVQSPFTPDWRPIPGSIDKPFHRDCAEDQGQAIGLHEA